MFKIFQGHVHLTPSVLPLPLTVPSLDTADLRLDMQMVEMVLRLTLMLASVETTPIVLSGLHTVPSLGIVKRLLPMVLMAGDK